MESPSISVVIAAYNEAPTVRGVVERAARAAPGVVQVVVVDDGSSDGTAPEARLGGAEVVSFAANRGKGEALRAGIARARGDVLVFLDADGQDDPAEIPRLLDALRPGVAMVIGSRFKGRLADGAITPVNHAGNLALTRLFNLLYRTGLTDTQAGFRAVRREALRLDALTARAYEIETDLTISVLQGGGTIVEVPVSRYPRAAGATSFVRVVHGTRILARMVTGRIAGAGRRAAPAAVARDVQ